MILHSGGTPGFSSVMHRFAGPGITVILLTNRGDRPLDHVARDLASFFAPSLAVPALRTRVARPRARIERPPARS